LMRDSRTARASVRVAAAHSVVQDAMVVVSKGPLASCRYSSQSGHGRVKRAYEYADAWLWISCRACLSGVHVMFKTSYSPRVMRPLAWTALAVAVGGALA